MIGQSRTPAQAVEVHEILCESYVFRVDQQFLRKRDSALYFLHLHTIFSLIDAYNYNVFMSQCCFSDRVLDGEVIG